ncbi:MAG: formate dehydrogenase accessory sulfurtransferase FdhD [Streptosporangiales bacterium]|nr:formate dehydrogenase accessory sulfurtransferase FdhD [Streptosporangiales bacterium]
MGRVTDRRRVLRVEAHRQVTRPDTLVAEEPLEIRVGGEPLTVTMRTPGDDFDLVAGFLATEDVVTKPDDLLGMRYCAGKDDEGRNTYNVVDATLAPGLSAPLLDVTRNFYTTSSCGICGKASLDAVRLNQPYDLGTDPTAVHVDTLWSLPDRLRQEQQVFERTGGLHAAGLFTADGELVCLREDIGRHNALDKLVGWALRQEMLPLAGHLVLLSGRASFELVQKALLAGVPVVAAVSAPSTLAVDLADEASMTLVGFLRGETMNVYTHTARLTGLADVSP